jgi:DNA-binding transcriptional MerR regulator
MPLSRSRDYFSIGEVLENVRSDFPDISISKIRFLEAEGLISPERTSSGYRKFFEPDVARLRYILSLQRDHFLPLKVIRERLAQADRNGGGYDSPPTAAAPAPPAAPAAAATEAPAAPIDMSGVSMNRAELLEASGLTDAELAGLEDFGLVSPSSGGSYDEADLMVAGAARKFFGYGVEPRHLRMYKQQAERETAFFDQIVSPVARRQNPEGAKDAARSMIELVQLGRQLREGVLRSALRELQ